MAQQSDVKNVVGRDRLISRIWQKLETGSLRFTAERRIGKTTVMKKMAIEPREGWQVVFIDLEGVASPEGFAEALLAKIRPLMPVGQSGHHWFQKFLDTVGGTEIGGVIKLPEFSKMGWRPTIEQAFEGICSQLGDAKLLLLFDELPYMLQKIAVYGNRSRDGENFALEMLDTLRAVRGEHEENLRMIYAGSVGLHHVITELRGTEFASQPVNDMMLVEIRSLEDEDAIQLANRLLKVEAVLLSDATSLELLSQTLAEATDRVPFYLERVIARLAEFDRPVMLDDVQSVVAHHLADDFDHWEMEHFRERLKIYYTGDLVDANGAVIPRSLVAREVLDYMSQETEPQSIDQVWQGLKAKLALTDRGVAVDFLKLLAQDHYLKSDSAKRYSFRFPLIQKWWVLAQGLGS
ncbi:hypothetical protein [Novipirellula rosea]|uniref:ATP-binding protein n=1 Tax=Novipirellula rosea TaxID=1031540 RepID=A0ABP8NKU5_9BACT